MESLAEALPRAQEQARELLCEYVAIGHPGIFGAAHIRETLKEADDAIMKVDTVRMLKVLQELRRLK